MDTSIFLARVFSLYFLIIAIAIVVRRKWYQEVFQNVFSCKHCLFLISFITVILGILLVVVHPMFTKDWRSVITILAWLTLLKGVLYLFLPEHLMKYKKNLLSSPSIYYISGAACLVLGAYIGYYGFFCGV